MKAIESTYGESIFIVENGIEKWQKISTKYLLEENETEEKAWERGKEKIDKWHKEKYPEMYGGKVIEHKKDKLSGSIGRDIETVTELTVLKSYELIVKNNPELKKVYDKQLKKISK